MANDLVLSTKLKNAIKRANPNGVYEFHLKTITVNGVKRGCSGFIVNKANNSIVYTTTEPVMTNLTYMYRFADSLSDFYGYRNRWCKTRTVDCLAAEIITLLQTTPQQARDIRN